MNVIVMPNGEGETRHRDEASSAVQRDRLLVYLRAHGNITTLAARQDLDVLHPAGRVLELRQRGFNIRTVRTYEATEHGKLHLVARYVLMAGGAS